MGLLGYFNGFGGRDMAVDLGTANTLVYVRGRGIVLSEPSVVAIDQRNGEVHAVGADAQRMIGRTPATISADRPLRHGVIADFEVCEAMLRQFMDKVLRSRFSRPRLVMCGLPREIELDSIEVRNAIDPAVVEIMTAVHDTLEDTPPELAADITRQGILIAGGGSLLRGFADRVHRETGMPVHMAEAPLTC